MNKKRFLPNNALRALLWCSLMLFTILWLIVLFPQLKIEHNVTTLLQGQATVPPPVEHQLTRQINHSIMWLIGNEKLENAMKSAERLQQSLQQIPQLDAIEGKQPALQHAWQHHFFTHRSQLLSPDLQQRLQQPTTYFQSILAQLYSPMSGITANELQQDPLLLTRGYALQQQHRHLHWEAGWIYANYEGKYYVLIRATLKDGQDDLTEKHKVISAIKQAEQQVKKEMPESEIESRSALYFSDYAAKSVEQDIKIIGIGSALGIVFLMIGIFRSLIPLLLLLCSLATGILCGMLAIWGLFGEIHLLTLALSASLVGVSADYSLHFLTERYFSQQHEKSRHTLNKLRPTLLFAFTTTALAYSVLGFAPLIILKQMAVYAVFGLAGALFTIFMLYPFFTEKQASRPFSHWHKIEGYLAFWQQSRWITWLIAILALLSLSLLMKLKVNDDVRLLQAQPAHLQHIEQKFDRILQQNSQLQYFIAQSDSEEGLLQRLEQLFNQLAPQQAIQPVMNFSYYLPSEATQKQHHHLVEQTVQQLASSQVPFKVNPHAYHYSPVSLSDFLHSPVGNAMAPFFIQHAEQYYALIPLRQSEDKLATAISQQLAGISYHNTTQDWSTLFTQSREHILLILLLSLVIVTGVLSYHFTFNVACRMIAVILISMLFAVASLVMTEQYFNLFSALALILILGMGLDYGIFLLKNQHFLSSSFIAVILSALTTQLSFGLLMLSQTHALVSFATVLCVGITSAFLLSPWVLKVSKIRG